MARAEVQQVRCDRCKRVELQPPQPPKEHPDFEAHFGEKVLRYDDLCETCKRAIDNSWLDLKEWNREIKQSFGVQAAPLQPAPDYTPPKPHSAAAAKK